MNNETIFFCALSFTAGGVFIHFFGCYRGHIRRLKKAVRDAAERNASGMLAWGHERDKWQEERDAWKGLRLALESALKIERKRINELLQQIEGLKGLVLQLAKAIESGVAWLAKIRQQPLHGEDERQEISGLIIMLENALIDEKP